MVITLLAPELTFGKAVVDLMSCLWHTPYLVDLAYEDGVPWTRYHTCLADMGGFILTFPLPSSDSPTTSGEDRPPSLSGVMLEPLSPIRLGHQGDPGHRHSQAISSHPGTPSQFSSDEETATISNQISPPEPLSLNNKSRGTTISVQLQRLLPHSMKSGKRYTIDHFRNAFLWNMERNTRLFGPLEWRSHPDLLRISTQVADQLESRLGGNNKNDDYESAGLPQGMSPTNFLISLAALEGNTSPLSAAQLLEARRMGLLPSLPHVTESGIRDKDKSDTLVKLAAVWQVAWLVIDLISRQVAGLSSSPLEFMVLAFSVLALLTYLMNWFKPKDVEQPYYIHAVRIPTCDELQKLAMLRPSPRIVPNMTHMFSEFAVAIQRSSTELLHKQYRMNLRTWYTGIAWSGMIFGSVHLLAWNFAFPTTVEKWLWRGSAIMTAAGPVAPGLPLLIISTLMGSMVPKRIKMILVWIYIVILSVILAFCRLFLFMEAYRSLYFLPPTAYLTTWTSDVPHLG